MSARSKNVLIFTVLIIKFWFLSKLAPIFGFFMKFTKKINHHLFILNCFFGFILSYIKNCIPLNIMYPKGQPLSSIKKYFYWYWKLYQQLQITLYLFDFFASVFFSFILFFLFYFFLLSSSLLSFFFLFDFFLLSFFFFSFSLFLFFFFSIFLFFFFFYFSIFLFFCFVFSLISSCSTPLNGAWPWRMSDLV